MSDKELSCYNGGFGAGGEITAFAAVLLGYALPLAAVPASKDFAGVMSAIYSIPGIVASMEFPSTDRPNCFK